MRLNLISNPSFKTDASGWSALGVGTTIARSTANYYFGSASLAVTKGAVSNAGASSARFTVTTGSAYAASAYVNIPSSYQTGALQLNVEWYTALSGGSLVSTSTGTLTTITHGSGWQRLGVLATAPATAVAALVKVIQPTAGTASEVFFLDAVLVEQSSIHRLYFDDVTQAKETTIVNKSLGPVPMPIITGLELNADVALDNLVLNTIDENDTVWVCTDIKNWWNHPDIDVPIIEKGYGDGGYDVRGRYVSRLLDLEGTILVQDRSYIPAARAKLIKAADLIARYGWLFVNESSVIKASRVRLAGQPQINTVNPRGRTEFVIPLRAVDPVKYEWYTLDPLGYTTAPITGAGDVNITNNGDYPVNCILRVIGPTSSLVITNATNTQSVSVQTNLGSGDTLDIDSYERSVKINDSYIDGRSHIPPLVEWVRLEPGLNVFQTTGTFTRIDVLYRSGWIG